MCPGPLPAGYVRRARHRRAGRRGKRPQHAVCGESLGARIHRNFRSGLEWRAAVAHAGWDARCCRRRLRATASLGCRRGGFITTNFKDPADAKAFEKMSAMQITGEVLEWHPAKGWTELPDSADVRCERARVVEGCEDAVRGRMAGQERHALRAERLDVGQKESISTGILTDNLRWMSDGSLLAGGQDANMPAVFQCRAPACRVGSAAIKIDLKTGKACAARAVRRQRWVSRAAPRRSKWAMRSGSAASRARGSRGCRRRSRCAPAAARRPHRRRLRALFAGRTPTHRATARSADAAGLLNSRKLVSSYAASGELSHEHARVRRRRWPRFLMTSRISSSASAPVSSRCRRGARIPLRP